MIWAVSTVSGRYKLKPDPHSSHSIVLEWLGEGNGRRLLDVGAADGLLSRHFTEQGWYVTAIEREPAVASVGAAYCERMLMTDLDGELPEIDGLFDVIVYADVLEHLVDPLRVMTALNRMLARGGLVVISIPNIAHLWIRLSLLMGRFEYTDRGLLDRTHLRFFTYRSLRSLITDAGLCIVRETATPVPIYQVMPAWCHGRWLAAFHGLSSMAARLLPRLLGYQFVVLARREQDES